VVADYELIAGDHRVAFLVGWVTRKQCLVGAAPGDLNVPHASITTGRIVRVTPVYSIQIASAAIADGPNLTDWLTAGGTVLLALITAVTLIVTVRITRADRRHDDKIRAEDRAESTRRLQQEREASDQRLREEREHAEQKRRRERQADTAYVLVQRIAALQPYLGTVPGTMSRALFSGFGPTVRQLHDDECRAAIDTLRHGTWAEASVLGPGDAAAAAADRYRYLVKLVDDLANNEPTEAERAVRTLRNYATWVRISLIMLAEDGAVPPIYGESAKFPLLRPAQHMPVWLPNPLPLRWVDEADADSRVRAPEPEAMTPATDQPSAGEPG
jgi:hypothetical protein